MNKLYFYLCFIFILSINIEINPLIKNSKQENKIDYQKAFNFEKIYQKHKNLIAQLGALENVLKEENDTNINNLQDNNLTLEIPNIQNNLKDPKKSFKKDCLSQLNSTKRNTILSPAKSSGLLIFLISLSTVIIVFIFGKDSIAGNLSIFTGLSSSSLLLKDLFLPFFNLISHNPGKIEALEELFAKNQWAIPKEIWPIIISKFSLILNNNSDKNQLVNFIEFALGLTLYKVPQNINSSSKINYNQNKEILLNTINNFFNDYQNNQNNKKEKFFNKFEQNKEILINNIGNFIEKLIYNHKEKIIQPIYIYSKKHFIGKTYFVNNILIETINDIFPGLIYYESFKINHLDDLKCSNNKPSKILNAIRNLCLSKLKGAIIFIDDADFLVNSIFDNSTKELFNELSCGYISSNYLGKSIDGDGIKLKLPPDILIILAGNKKIKDKNLKKYLITLNLPNPKIDKFRNYALNIIETNKNILNLPELFSVNDIPQKYKDQIEEIIKETENFIDLSINIKKLIELWTKK